MCSSLNPQKSIRIDAELCDGVQAYALANRLALKPRWFSNFINSAVREKLVREGFLPGNHTNDAPDGSRCVLGGVAAQGGDVLEDKKLLDRIAQSEEPYLAYLVEKNSRADNQDNYPHGFNYPQNPDEKPAIVDSRDNCPKTVGVVFESQNREVR